MECEVTADYGRSVCVPSWKAGCGGLRQLGAGDEARAAGPAALSGRAAGTAATVAADPGMDEISYWVYTKCAPCLFNYDNIIKKQYEAAQTSKLCNDKSATVVPSPKKKKRKLSILDGDCESPRKQQPVFFESSNREQCPAPSSCKSGTMESDIDFNIKNSSIQAKPKRINMKKNGRTLHKKNKVVTSTPLRRSLRRTHNDSTNPEKFDISFDSYNCSNLNNTNGRTEVRTTRRFKKSLTKLPNEQTNCDKKNSSSKPKLDTTQNGQYEDLSDVSGFTANYIRSTKLHSTSKSNRNLRSKGSRKLVMESQPNLPKNDTLLVCVNKSVNATAELPHTSILNCSTDSSQNIINLITTKHSDNNVKVNRSTSLLKFVDVKKSKAKETVKEKNSKQISKTDLDISNQTKSSGNSRYPKRHKNHSMGDVTINSSHGFMLTRASLDKRKNTSKNAAEYIDSDRKENPAEASPSKTRSGKNGGLALRNPDNSVLVYSNCTEGASSGNTINVANQPLRRPKSWNRTKRASTHKHRHVRKSADKSGLQKRDSVRERSGFTACFSDSDNDSEPQKPRKFFL